MKVDRVLRIGVLTDDLEKTMEHYKNFGFENWLTVDFDLSLIPVLHVVDSDEQVNFKGAMYDDEYIHMEILQPMCEGVFMDWVKAHGTGVHHIEMRPVGDFDEFANECQDKGYKVSVKVMTEDRSEGFIYFNTFKELGFNIEIHK